MLVIDRKIGQRVVLHLPTGERVTILLTDCSSSRDPFTGRPVGRAKIGIVAPQDVTISRDPK